MVDISIGVGEVGVTVGTGSSGGTTTSPGTQNGAAAPATSDAPSVTVKGVRVPIFGPCFSCQHPPASHTVAGCHLPIGGIVRCPCRRHMKDPSNG